MNATIRHVLLDIEGTTCPVRFVSETLFPYAAARMGAFLEESQSDPAVQALVAQLAQAWRVESDPASPSLRQVPSPNSNAITRILPYLHWLIQVDRKLTPLKELQGLVWEEGYKSGALKGPLYPDVAPALRRWRQAGLGLSVYSSGSVKAQQLIYGYSNAGDLRFLFQHWFDTKIGDKRSPESYNQIVTQLNVDPQNVLFLSDAVAELEAASSSGLAVLLCERSDSPKNSLEHHHFSTIHCFDEIDLGSLTA
jgi:enolase-phosphatase E1